MLQALGVGAQYRILCCQYPACVLFLACRPAEFSHLEISPPKCTGGFLMRSGRPAGGHHTTRTRWHRHCHGRGPVQAFLYVVHLAKEEMCA